MKLRLTILGLTALMLLAVAAVHSQSTSSAPSITVYANPT
jgi:hypothetical protein